MPAHRVLVLFAHPALEKSRVNRRLAAEARGVSGITFHDLYEAYPDFCIQVEREQALLEEHDLLVWQHPMFWYSTPALVKQWEDLVLEHGWAYGSTGDALAGKRWFSVMTTGGSEDAYRPGGYNRYSVRELLRPLEQTATLCRMEFLPPLVIHGTHGMKEAEMDRHASTYRRFLEALRDGRFDEQAARREELLGPEIDHLIAAPNEDEEEANDAR